LCLFVVTFNKSEKIFDIYQDDKLYVSNSPKNSRKLKPVWG
jgi:NAD+--asparagine ADP-ribosyltransferase